MGQPAERGQATTIFGRWALFILRNHRAATAVVALLTLLALAAASRLTVNSDLLALMPPKDPAIIALRALESEEGGVNLVTVTVRGERAATKPFLNDLQAALEADDKVDYAVHDIDDELAWRLGVLTFSQEELVSVRERLQGALSLGPAVANPFIAARLLDLGPMTEKLGGADARSGLMSNGDMERLVIRPNGRARDLPFARSLMAFIQTTIDGLDPASKGVEVVYISGAYRFNVEDYEGVLADSKLTGSISLVLVLTLMIVAMRDLRALLLIFTPLVVGTIWSFGFAALSVGVLNTFTSILGALLLGLGIDFSIHLYLRYREERLISSTLEEAVASAWDKVGPPSFAAAITTFFGFGALLVAQFLGFRQMGLLLSFGVLLCFVAAITVLPLLIRWRESQPRPLPRRRLRLPEPKTPPTYRLAPLGLVGLAIITVLFTAFIPRIGFEYDLSELRRDGMAYEDLSELEQELTRASYAAIVASYPDAASLNADHARVQKLITDKQVTHIGRAMSLRSVIPEDQDARLETLRAIVALTQHPNYGFLPASIRQNLDQLGARNLNPVTASDLPRGLQHLLGAADGRHRMMIFASGNMWDLREVHALKEEVKATFPTVEVAGEYLALGTLYNVVRQDAPLVAGLAFLFVVLGTFLDTRRVLPTLASIAVLVTGMLWAGGMVSLVGVKLSLVNVVAIPILLGIGVDVVIHMLHRFSEEGPGGVLRALSTTGFAAGLSSMTTILSFAALSGAGNQGIESLGMLVLVGLSSVTIGAFLVLPVGWMTIWKIAGEAPADTLDNTTAPPPE